MERCNDTEKAYIEKYREKINEAVANYTSLERNGAWSVACIQHGFLSGKCTSSSKYLVPCETGAGITDGLLKFMRGERSLNVDLMGWPSNKGCNGMSNRWGYLTVD